MRQSTESVREELRRVLLDPQDAIALDVHGRTDAGVLVALYCSDGDLHVVFTKRRDDMRRHPGEISFPGELLGALQPTPTIATGYAVYPFVGMIDAGLRWEMSEREVQEVIELPLKALRDGYGRRRLVRRGLPIRTDTYLVGDHLIWGATARILADLLDRLDRLDA
jgi:hypothetical protein